MLSNRPNIIDTCQNLNMRYITSLENEEKVTLEEGYRNHAKHHFRNRCKSILMSDDGISIPEIARFFKTRTRTIYSWFSRWEKMGIVGLMILPGRGRTAALKQCNVDEIRIIEEAVRKNPQSLREVCKNLSVKFGFEITKKMLQRFLKKNSGILGNASEKF